jgi:hypothetical protein
MSAVKVTGRGTALRPGLPQVVRVRALPRVVRLRGGLPLVAQVRLLPPGAGKHG